MLWMLFILLSILSGLAAIVLVVCAIVFNSVWMLAVAIGAGLLAWLFGYTSDDLEMY